MDILFLIRAVTLYMLEKRSFNEAKKKERRSNVLFTDSFDMQLKQTLAV